MFLYTEKKKSLLFFFMFLYIEKKKAFFVHFFLCFVFRPLFHIHTENIHHTNPYTRQNRRETCPPAATSPQTTNTAHTHAQYPHIGNHHRPSYLLKDMSLHLKYWKTF